MQFIEIKDFILLPLYLAIIYAFAYPSRNGLYSLKHPLRKYYIPALSVRILGAIGLGLVYQYYYGYGGDTGSYFYNSKLIVEYFHKDPNTFFDLVFKPVLSTLEVRRNIAWNDDVFGFSEANYFPIRVLAILQLFTFGTYLPCAVFFAVLAFSGTWKLYLAFVNMFPALYKQFAIAILFMPSVFFWGSGILKDSIAMAALCWLFYCSYALFILGHGKIKNSIIIIVSLFAIIVIKAYIAMAFIPGLLIWIFLTYKNRIKSQALQTVALPFLVLVIAFGSYLSYNSIAAQDARFSTDRIQKQAVVVNTVIKDAGSSINIGVTAGMGPAQLLAIAPLAITTAIFRPFLFEVNNVLMLLSAIEGSYIIYLFGSVIFKTGITKSFRIIMGTPLLIFSLIFTLVFAYAVGFSTSNFGTLVRYKIPFIPFFMCSLFIIIYKGKMKREKR
jgi:hypothetical protein